MCFIYDDFVMSVQAWFLDQFGGLHDGKNPYPGAISTCMYVCFENVMRKTGNSFGIF